MINYFNQLNTNSILTQFDVQRMNNVCRLSNKIINNFQITSE
jgi:hypothetical protein